MQEWSPRTKSYVEAMIREGDHFDDEAWLRRVREEEARARSLTHSSQAALPEPRSTANTEAASAKIDPPPGRKSFVSLLKPRSARAQKNPRSLKHNSMRERLGKVCDAWDAVQESRWRNAIYPYIAAVYALVRRYQERKQVKRLLRRACRFADLPFDKGADPFAVIIRCTSGDDLDAKAVSKLARALRYADYRNRPVRLLVPFIRKLGGINACVARYTDLRRVDKGI